MVSVKLHQKPKKKLLNKGNAKNAKIKKLNKKVSLQKLISPQLSINNAIQNSIDVTKKMSLQKPISPKLSISNAIENSTDVTIKKKKMKYKMPSKVITDDLVTSCLVALEKITAHHDKKNAIFGDETQIFMEIRCVKIPNSKANIKFVLPHTTSSSSGEVCLVTPDIKKGKKSDHEPTVDLWEEMLRSAGVTSVKTVLPMRQLRVEYDQFELRRRLLTQHDFIMVDNRVMNHVSHILGKLFFKKHNMLIPVRINEKKDLKKNIDIGLRTVMLRLSEGQTSTILVGHTAMPQNQIKENILALIKKLKEKYPGGEMNIRSLSIKLPLSLSLPLYLTLRSPNSISAPKIKKQKPKNYITYEDELTTKPGSVVRVAPDGTVLLKKFNGNNLQKEHSDVEDGKEESENEDLSNDDD